MAFIADAAFDAAIGYLITNGTSLHICSQEPTTYAEAATTYELAVKGSMTLGSAEAGDTSGRKTVVPAIVSGDSVTADATGTATHWAITNGTDTLVATGSLAASQSLTSGNPVTLAAFDITFPDAVDE